MVDIYYNVTINQQTYSCTEFQAKKTATTKSTDDEGFLSRVLESPMLQDRTDAEWNKRDAISDIHHPEQVGQNVEKKEDIAYTILKKIEQILKDSKITLEKDDTKFPLNYNSFEIDEVIKKTKCRSIAETRRLVHIARNIKENYNEAYDNFRVICPICWTIQGLISILSFGLFQTRKQRVNALFKKIERAQFQNHYEITQDDEKVVKYAITTKKTESRKISAFFALLNIANISMNLDKNTVSNQSRKQLQEIAEQIKENYMIKYYQLNCITRCFKYKMLKEIKYHYGIILNNTQPVK